MRGFRAAFVLASALGLSLSFGACFIEPAEPSVFRFECAADSECKDNEVCANGLCQQACGGPDDDPCNFMGDEPVCFNGYCSSVCPIVDGQEDVCPPPQSCFGVEDSGICTVLCEDDGDCPAGGVCFGDTGVCVSSCMETTDCGSGEECLGGFCIPSDAGGGAP